MAVTGNSNGREVDFIAPMRGRPRMLVQVCESLAEPQTLRGSLSALGPAADDPAQASLCMAPAPQGFCIKATSFTGISQRHRC